MKALSLFTGVAGGDLGLQHLLGWNCTGYVEINEYCQQIIAQRIADGLLSHAPIFSDVRTFAREGYAKAYSGLVDVVTAGFPCQPHSVAGKRRGADDDRDLWPETADIIEMVRPQYAFLENVQGLVSNGYVLRVIQNLENIGYTVEKPLLLGADDCGADHHRKRVWILAHTAGFGREGRTLSTGSSWQYQPENDGCHSLSTYTQSQRLEKPKIKYVDQQQSPIKRSDCRWWEISDTQKRLCAAQGVSNGMAHWVDRVEATGNGQVSIVAATAWNILINQAHQNT